MRRPSGKCLPYVIAALVILSIGAYFLYRYQAEKYQRDFYASFKPSSADTLRIGITPNASSLPIWAVSRSASSLTVPLRIVEYPTSGALLQATAAKQVDIALVGLEQYALLAPYYQPGTIIGTYAVDRGSYQPMARPGFDVKASQQTIRIAFAQDSPSSLLAAELVAVLAPLSCQKVTTHTPTQAFEMLTSGQVDAAIVPTLDCPELLTKHYTVVDKLPATEVPQVFVAAPGYVDNGRTKEFLKDWFSLIDYMQTAPGAVQTAIAEDTGRDIAQVQKLMPLTITYLAQQPAWQYSSSLETKIAFFTQVWSLAGVYKSPFERSANTSRGQQVSLDLLRALNLGDDSEPEALSDVDTIEQTPSPSPSMSAAEQFQPFDGGLDGSEPPEAAGQLQEQEYAPQMPATSPESGFDTMPTQEESPSLNALPQDRPYSRSPNPSASGDAHQASPAAPEPVRQTQTSR